VRPERIAIVPDGTSSEGANRLPARVQNTIYLGDHALAVLDVAGNEEFMVKLQLGAHDSLRSGESVFITFRPEDCLALDPV
jgi:putative spermidine/putrescine transport system ATP-binding protein